MAVEKTIASTSVAEVVDRILDKGVVIDGWGRAPGYVLLPTSQSHSIAFVSHRSDADRRSDGHSRALMTHPDEILTAEQLLQQVWGYPPRTGDPSQARWHIKNLRAKIEPDPAHPTHIRTNSHNGYLWSFA